MKAEKVETTQDQQEAQPSFLDCYRIALDFGMPAALKAFESLTLDSKPADTDISEQQAPNSIKPDLIKS